MSNGVPISSKKMIQSLKEIVNGVTDAEIYSTLKDCNMDPNEAVNRLLSQDTFHEVKSKREKKKESKDTTEFRPRGGSSSNRGGRSGTDRYAGRSSSTHYSSSESGGVYGKPGYKRENGTSSYTASASATPAPRAAPRTANWNPPTYSDSHQPSTYSTTDAVSVPQPSSGYQSAWSGAPGQKSMADIVKMGRPQNKGYTTPNPSQQSISHNHVPEYNASPDNDWPSIEPSQPDWPSIEPSQPDWPTIEPSQPLVHTHADSGLNSGQSNLPFDRSNQYVGYETNEAEPQHESSSEDHIEDHDHDVPVSNEPLYEHDLPAPVPAEPLYDHGSYRNMDSYHTHDDASEQKEAEEVDAPVSSASENIQKLSIQEEEHMDQPEDDVIPSVVIPDHLQVHTADLSHLSFGTFGANLNAGLSGTSSVEQPETTNREYYDDGPTRTLESDLVQRTGAESYDLPSVSQGAVLNQDVPEVSHSSQYGFPPATHAHTYDNPQLLNSSFPQSQTPPQTQISTPFLNAMAADTNSLLAANGHPARESDLSYSQFSVSQSMPTRYANSVSSINDPTISIAEALKSVGLSSSQPGQQTLPTGPSIQQHLAMHPYSQHPLGPYANMMSYPFLPQSYTYMPSGFQPGFAGNSTYHQQLAAMLPQYKNSVSLSGLTQSPAAASGYGSYGGSTAVPGSYQVSQPAGPAGPAGSYDDVLNAHFKDTSHLLSLQQQQQQNENSQMWVHGGGSRTMPAVPASAYYNLQSQNQQQPSGFRQGQQPSQSYGGAAHNYPDFFQSQTGISQEHQLQQNPRDGSHVGGSQGQPKLQTQQQLWQNAGY